jgi:hypothetical protein
MYIGAGGCIGIFIYFNLVLEPSESVLKNTLIKIKKAMILRKNIKKN